eukprot:UN31490
MSSVRRGKSNKTSSYVGVHWVTQLKRWLVTRRVSGETKRGGTFRRRAELQAAERSDELYLTLCDKHGKEPELRRLNFPDNINILTDVKTVNNGKESLIRETTKINVKMKENPDNDEYELDGDQSFDVEDFDIKDSEWIDASEHSSNDNIENTNRHTKGNKNNRNKRSSVVGKKARKKRVTKQHKYVGLQRRKSGWRGIRFICQKYYYSETYPSEREAAEASDVLVIKNAEPETYSRFKFNFKEIAMKNIQVIPVSETKNKQKA